MLETVFLISNKEDLLVPDTDPEAQTERWRGLTCPDKVSTFLNNKKDQKQSFI